MNRTHARSRSCYVCVTRHRRHACSRTGGAGFQCQLMKCETLHHMRVAGMLTAKQHRSLRAPTRFTPAAGMSASDTS
jgi:hypothetical protein